MIKKILLAGILAFVSHSSFAQVSGSFDPSFGGNGKVSTNVGLADFNVLDHAVQPDGKIIMVGQSTNGSGAKAFIARANADGTLDTGFYLNGKQQWTVEKYTAVAIQPDGKILIGGSQGSLMRLNADGTLDSNFQNVSGTGTGDLSKEAVAIALQPDGKILGLYHYPSTDNTSDVKIFRYNTNGALDNTFNGTGFVLADIGTNDFPKTITIDTTGKIIVGGDFYTDGSNNKFFYLRFNANGSPDTTFNTTGKVVLAFSGVTYTESFGIALQPDGKMINGGLLTAGTNGVYLYMVRLNANGSMDTTFNGSSYTELLPLNSSSYHKGRIKLAVDGKIVISNFEDPNQDGNVNAVFRRFNSNATADAGFGTAGKASVDFYGFADSSADFDLTTDGKILFSGNAKENFLQNELAIAKLNSNGTLDATFSSDGKATIYFTDIQSNDSARCIARQSDGKIIVGGSSYFAGWDYFSLVRYNTDGTLDTSFGGSGVAVIERIGHVSGIAVDADGKIVLVGNQSSMYALRLNADATLDTTFGTNGVNDFGSLSFGGTVEDVLIRPNGKIVIVGSLGDFTNGDSDFMVAQLNANGTFDNTFGTNGISKAGSFVGGFEQYQAARLQPDGKIVAGGSIYNGQHYELLLARYNTNGTLDATFNGNGTSTYSSGNSDALASLALQTDGKIVVTGTVNGEENGISAIRFTNSGSLDTSFGNNGVATFAAGTYSAGQEIFVTGNQKITVLGSSATTTDYQINVGRFDQNGILDPVFGTAGSFSVQINAGNETLGSGLISGNNLFLAADAYDAGFEVTNFAVGKVFLDTVLATGDLAANPGFSFYPNPAKDSITFPTPVTEVSISSMDGKSKKARVFQNTVDVSRLPAGSYLVRFKAENGATYSKKLLKQ